MLKEEIRKAQNSNNLIALYYLKLDYFKDMNEGTLLRVNY
jgi:GGDEF domain-containing protein